MIEEGCISWSIQARDGTKLKSLADKQEIYDFALFIFLSFVLLFDVRILMYFIVSLVFFFPVRYCWV